jgi:hypothetical protein
VGGQDYHAHQQQVQAANEPCQCPSNHMTPQLGCLHRPCLVEADTHRIANIHDNRPHVEVTAAIETIITYFGQNWPDGDRAVSKAVLVEFSNFIRSLPSAGFLTFPDWWTEDLRTRFNQLHLIRGSALNAARGEVHEEFGGTFHLYKGLRGVTSLVYDHSQQAEAPDNAILCRVRGLLGLVGTKTPLLRPLYRDRGNRLGYRYTLFLIGGQGHTGGKAGKTSGSKRGLGGTHGGDSSNKAPRSGTGPGGTGGGASNQPGARLSFLFFLPFVILISVQREVKQTGAQLVVRLPPRIPSAPGFSSTLWSS